MYFEFADRQFWDTLIFAVFGVGVLLAGIRLYRDFTRPLPPNRDRPGERSYSADADTEPPPLEKDDTLPQ